MIVVREPVLDPVAIAELRPTQITVGMREGRGEAKAASQAQGEEDRQIPRRSHDPGGEGAEGSLLHHRPSHHLALALHKEGVRNVLVLVVSDLSALDADAFWTVLDQHAA